MKRISLFLAMILAVFFLMGAPAKAAADHDLQFEPPIFEPPFFFEPPIFMPLPPIIFPDFILDLDEDNQTRVNHDSGGSPSHWMSTVTMPFEFDGEEAGFLKFQYNRLRAKDTEGEWAIQFVTAEDTFFIGDDIIIHGKRTNKETGEFRGAGTTTKILISGWELEVNINYYFAGDAGERKVLFFIQK